MTNISRLRGTAHGVRAHASAIHPSPAVEWDTSTKLQTTQGRNRRPATAIDATQRVATRREGATSSMPALPRSARPPR
jgi:hypothetical protein